VPHPSSPCPAQFSGFCAKNPTRATRWASHTNQGYLAYEPSDASSAEGVIAELDLLLSAGRLDNHSRQVITAEYIRANHLSSCPVDRSAELCGRLTVGQELFPGESITNAQGETLCFTYDGALRHIDANGFEFFSTAQMTRGRGAKLAYESHNQHLRMRDADNRQVWTTATYEHIATDAPQRLFATFLSGPCHRYDPTEVERYWVYDYKSFSPEPIDTTCDATDACAGSGYTPPTRSAAYLAQRARTDASYAVKVAQNLFAQSAAFATTNEPGTRPIAMPPPPPRPSLLRPYKALVVLFMRGGADTFNLLVPHSQCDDRQLQQQYLDVRGAVAIAANQLLQIAVPAGSQRCDRFGVHPRMQTLAQLYADGDASFYANTGNLLYPATKMQYLDETGTFPPQLFGHNTQQNQAETVDPVKKFADGVLGRILTVLDEQARAAGEVPLKTAAYSVTSNKFLFRGWKVDGTAAEPIMLSARHGMLVYEGSDNADTAENAQERNRTLTAIGQLAGFEAASIYAETHNAGLRASLADSERISALLAQVSLSQNWNSAKGRATFSEIVEQLEQVASLISQRAALEAERDVFLVELSGFDSHANLVEQQNDLFQSIDEALSIFAAEMKAQGVWQQVTLAAISEFGRTMTNNGRGTDHAWGGNYFIAGGPVRGGLVHGTFPELRVDGPDSINSKGQMLPTTPWESLWKPIASWMGVTDERIDGGVLPNAANFGSIGLLNRTAVFVDS